MFVVDVYVERFLQEKKVKRRRKQINFHLMAFCFSLFSPLPPSTSSIVRKMMKKFFVMREMQKKEKSFSSRRKMGRISYCHWYIYQSDSIKSHSTTLMNVLESQKTRGKIRIIRVKIFENSNNWLRWLFYITIIKSWFRWMNEGIGRWFGGKGKRHLSAIWNNRKFAFKPSQLFILSIISDYHL